MSKIYLCIACMLAAFSIFSACTRTEDLEPLPQSKILTYKVVNLPDAVIYGAVDHTDHTITVYVPFYYGLTVIDPEITVSPGAHIKEEVMPVEVEGGNVSYTVLGADGSNSTYTLKIALQSTPSLEISWSPAGALTYPADQVPNITGNFLSTNTALARVWLIPEKGDSSIEINPVAAGGGMFIDPSEGTYILSAGKVPAGIDTGYYKVKVSFLGHNVELKEPLHIIHRQPDLLLASRVAAQGGTISYTAYNSVFIGLKSAKVTINGTAYTLPVEKYTRTEMTLKIPEDFPPGEYNYTAQFGFEFEGWATVNKTGYLKVTPK